LTFFLVFLFPVCPVWGDENAFDVLIKKDETVAETPAQKLITFYQRRISPHDSAKCLFLPTCSAFGKTALQEYGFFAGTLMSIDRLFYREGQASMKYYQYMPDEDRYIDPVHHNYIFDTSKYYQ
jgi:putative component of membrane protein insertase Oxa1/YidC/SpoIIIJ protein YidD